MVLPRIILGACRTGCRAVLCDLGFSRAALTHGPWVILI